LREVFFFLNNSHSTNNFYRGRFNTHALLEKTQNHQSSRNTNQILPRTDYHPTILLSKSAVVFVLILFFTLPLRIVLEGQGARMSIFIFVFDFFSC